MEQNLPSWNLSDLYNGISDSKLSLDKETIKKQTTTFIDSYKNKIDNNLKANTLLEAIKLYENIQSLLSSILSFSYLLYATDVNNKEVSNFLQQNREFAQGISSSLVFFDLSINEISEDVLQKWLKESKELSFYSSFLEQMRKFKPYQLSESAEQVLIAKQSVARTSWVKLYDETLAALVFNDPLKEGNKVSLSTVLNAQLSSDKEVRKKAALSLKEGLATKEELIVTVVNNVVKDHSINNQLRGFKNHYSSMNLHNLITDEVMENLVSVVAGSYKDISKRYYKLKAKILGVDKINYWDRNAPLFNTNSKFSFNEAKDIVLAAFGSFNKEFANIAELFFKNNWIDAKLLPNKMSGAFAHPATVKAHPYVMVNFHGGYLDVTTLAHELGHGVHQYLARDTGELQSGTPLVLAETASIFGEQLVFDYLKNTTKDQNMQKYLLSNKIEGIINSVHRQIAFHIFEMQLHNLRVSGELTAQQIQELFFVTQRDCLGEGVALDKKDGIFWSYVSHFFHVPFYVYAYAFGDCLVRSLYAAYKGGNSDFMNNYLDLLKSGGKVTPELAVKKFGFDITQKDFWQNGLNITAKLIDELEELI